MPQHGFARTSVWDLSSTVMDRPEGVSVRLTLPVTDEIRARFPHAFELAYVVTLTAHQLSTDLHVKNPGDKPLKFQALLHGYLAVPDVYKIKIQGLEKGLTYRDKVRNNIRPTWEGGALVIDQEVDRSVADRVGPRTDRIQRL
jgi:glucose-6-phosphate 1-epimerase